MSKHNAYLKDENLLTLFSLNNRLFRRYRENMYGVTIVMCWKNFFRSWRKKVLLVKNATMFTQTRT